MKVAIELPSAVASASTAIAALLPHPWQLPFSALADQGPSPTPAVLVALALGASGRLRAPPPAQVRPPPAGVRWLLRGLQEPPQLAAIPATQVRALIPVRRPFQSVNSL